MERHELFPWYKNIKETIDGFHAVILVGAGGAGMWSGYVLSSLNLFEKTILHIYDGDKFDPTNFNRIPLPPHLFSGKNKAITLKKLLQYLNPKTKVVAYPRHFIVPDDIQKFRMNPILVIDATDKVNFQKALSNAMKDDANTSAYSMYIKVGYENMYASAVSKVATFGDNSDGYAETPSNVVTAMASGITLFQFLKDYANYGSPKGAFVDLNHNILEVI